MKAFKVGIQTLRKLLNEFYEIPEIKDLYEKRDKYDLFFADNFFNEVRHYILLIFIFIWKYIIKNFFFYHTS